jgi:hypothetical protein
MKVPATTGQRKASPEGGVAKAGRSWRQGLWARQAPAPSPLHLSSRQAGEEFPAEDKEPIEVDSRALCSGRLSCLCHMRPGWRLSLRPTGPWPRPRAHPKQL